MAIAPHTIFPSIPHPPLNPPMISTTISHKSSNCISLLKSCSNIKEFLPIHAHLITTKLIQDPLVANHVLQFLISTDNLDYVHLIFSYANLAETIIWNALLETQLEDASPEEVFQTYYHMVTQGVFLDITTFHHLIRACCKDLSFQRGNEIHGRILKSGFGSSWSLKNNLMGMYTKFGKLEEVELLFDKCSDRNIVRWNTMISCYVKMGLSEQALDLFHKMMINGIEPDAITMVSLISACAKLRNLEMGEKLHVYIEENGLEIRESLLNCLVDMYIKCGKMEQAFQLFGRYKETNVVLGTTFITGYVKNGDFAAARELFNQMTERNLISWTTMISGYVQGGLYRESLQLFREMRQENVTPDEIALLTALSACSRTLSCMLGRAIHSLVVKYGMTIDGFLGNSLIDLYAKCEQIDEAHKLFKQLPRNDVVSWNTMLDGYCRSGDIEKARAFYDKIPEKDVVSWNTIINCYAKFHQLSEVYELFHKMQSSNVKPNKLTLISLLSCCASLGALNHGIWIHAYIKKNEIELDEMLVTALIDMYGKCGSIKKAYEVFSGLKKKNVYVWTAMIAAHAMEGQAQKAINLFLEMEESGTKPDYITFIALLSACSHGSLVDEGYNYFKKMSSFYNMHPQIQHYGCMVDLLGRVGHLEDAVNFIETMPAEPDALIWSSLMRACAIHHNVQLGEHVFTRLIEIDPLNDSAYVLLSNIYANAGRLDDLSRVRTKLKELGIRKQPGCSLIEESGVLHEFTSGDFSNPRSADIYSMLNEMERRLDLLKPMEASPCHHSERLAVAFGLISSPSKTTIHIVNNIRMCNDCHSAMKTISKAYEREIVIRDCYRFHRFQDGTCTCNDHW